MKNKQTEDQSNSPEIPNTSNNSSSSVEQASEKYLEKWRALDNTHLSSPIHAERMKNNFIAGAKWREEQLQDKIQELIDKYKNDGEPDVKALDVISNLKALKESLTPKQ